MYMCLEKNKILREKKILKRSFKASIRVCKVAAFIQDKEGNVHGRNVQDPIFLHKESWGQGDPTGSH